MKSERNEGWQRLVSRAFRDRFFLGSALTAYKASQGFDDDQLADWLGCSRSNLERLALCRLPEVEERLARDVRQIAEFTDCDADRLLAALREAAALDALRKAGPSRRETTLMAARDRKPDSEGGGG